MRLLDEQPRSLWGRLLYGTTAKKTLLLLILIFFFLIIPAGALLIKGTGPGGKAFLHSGGVGGALKRSSAYFCRTFTGRTTSIEIPSMDISMKKGAYRKILAKREESLGKPIFLTGPDDYVRAFVRIGEDLSEVRIRLKGDWISQLEHSRKWSFRIEVKGDDSILGMKRFSIHHPRSRNYIGEWLFHRALKRSGIIALRYEFLDVTLNNRHLGIYAMEEHFEKRLVENNRRREGPILRFNEDLVWEDAYLFHDAPRESKGTGTRSFRASSIDAFNTGRILNDPVLFEQFKTGASLLEAVRLGRLKTSEAFDVGLMADYLAMLDLFGGKHAISFLNLRFYYNPVTSLLEPIGFDANAGGRTIALIGEGARVDLTESTVHERFKEDLLSDPVFFKAYIGALERISRKEWLDDFFGELDDELDKNLTILRSEFTNWSFSKNAYYRNAEYIRKMLSASVTAVHAYIEKPGASPPGKIIVKAGNIQKLPVEVLSIRSKDGEILFDFEGREPVLQPRLTHVSYVPIEFSPGRDAYPAGGLREDLFLDYRIFGTGPEGRRSVEVYPWPFLEEDLAVNYLAEKAPNVENFDFLVIDEDEKEILVKPGVWTIDRNLMIPAGYLVRGGEATEIRLVNGASIVTRSPLFLTGSEEAPIVFSADSTGKGMLCLNTGGKSTLDHVIFKNLSAPLRGGSRLTGAVTFYEANVKLYKCLFVEARCEDALNIVRSDFEIEQCLVRDAFSDGLDVDFGEGSIRKCSFDKTGNDAIDLAGSYAVIEDCYVSNAGDKGLTVGEDSEAGVTDLTVTGSYIAVGGKDASEVVIDGLIVSDCSYGLTAYQKKPEFGPAELKVKNLSIDGAKQEILVETGSSITVDNILTTGTETNVFELLYPEG